jgi:preprotein translocase subunit SecD
MTRMDALWPEVRDALRELRDTVGTIRRVDAPPGELHVRVSQPEGWQRPWRRAGAGAAGGEPDRRRGSSTLDVRGRGRRADRHPERGRARGHRRPHHAAILEIVRRRVDEAGTREPTIQRQGADRILIQVPGIGSAQELKA